MRTTVIDFIRHGEPVGGSAIRGNGIDDELSELGWQQMRSAVADYIKWDIIISSPMLRCCQFSQELAAKNQIPVLIDSNLKEVGFGAWEGRSQDAIKKENPDEYRDFYLDPVNSRPAGSEPLNMFCARVVASYNNMIQQHQGKHILCVTHAGVIRAILTHALQTDLKNMYKIKVRNAGLSRIKQTNTEIFIERHGFSF